MQVPPFLQGSLTQSFTSAESPGQIASIYKSSVSFRIRSRKRTYFRDSRRR